MTKLLSLVELENQVKLCSKCEISKTKCNYVFSRGNFEAKVFCIGEAPGSEEDLQGLPFVGRSGRCLDRAIRSLNLDPEEDVYVANIIKCHPPDNRRPSNDEICNCIPYLIDQLDLIQPKVILALGTTAIQSLLNTTESISSLLEKDLTYNNIRVIACYHPSYIIRTGGVSSKYFSLFFNKIKLAFDYS